MSTPEKVVRERANKKVQGELTFKVPQKASIGSINSSPVRSYELGDLLVDYLELLEVEYVFGIPGGAIEPLYNALARSERRGGPRAVVARHETGAAFMADGYARNSGKLGVCCGTAGPGTTNLITGVASAYDNQSPLLVITAQTALTNFGKRAAQESGDTGINTVAMFEHCTHYSSLVSHPDQFEPKLISAIMQAMRSPKGPTHLSIPLDVFRSESSIKKPSYLLDQIYKKTSLVDEEGVSVLSEELIKSSRTVFIVGEQCANAISQILDVAMLLNIEIVTTPHAKGLVSTYHPLFRGVIGFSGHKSALHAVSREDTDLIVAIGSTLSETASNNWDTSVLNANLIHVDSAESNFSASPMAKQHVLGNILSTFEKVLDLLNIKTTLDASLKSRSCQMNNSGDVVGIENNKHRQFSMEDERKCFSEAIPIKPQRLMYLLPNLLPPNTRYLCDSGNSMVWCIHYLHPHDRRIKSRRTVMNINNVVDHDRQSGRRLSEGGVFWTCLEYGSMGWAIGSAIGTALACEDDPVVCITGDGAMLMSGGEVSVARQENLNIIFIILNDSEFGMVKHGQRLGTGEPTAFSLPEVDFVMWGESMGVPGYYIHSSQDLEQLKLKEILSIPGPKIFDVYVDAEEVPPIKSRLQALGTVDK